VVERRKQIHGQESEPSPPLTQLDQLVELEDHRIPFARPNSDAAFEGSPRMISRSAFAFCSLGQPRAPRMTVRQNQLPLSRLTVEEIGLAQRELAARKVEGVLVQDEGFEPPSP